MDFTTIGGLVLSTIFLIIGITLARDLIVFWNAPSVMITVGCSLCAAILTAQPWSKSKHVLKVMKITFVKQKYEYREVISTLTSFAEKARREGLLALEDDIEQLKDDFLQKCLQLVVDGTDPALVKIIMDTDLFYMDDRHKNGKKILQDLATLAPAFGMIGTLIGLVIMLKNLENISMIGPSMAVALITTFYGAIMANMICTPMAYKLDAYNKDELNIKQMMIEGMLAIQAGDNPRIVEERLKAFLAPNLRVEKKTEEEQKED